MKFRTVVVGLLVVLAAGTTLGASPEIQVSGIVKTGNRFAAYIGGQLYNVDQVVAGCRIVAIDDGGITVESSTDGQVYHYSPGQGSGVLVAEDSDGEPWQSVEPPVENDSLVTTTYSGLSAENDSLAPTMQPVSSSVGFIILVIALVITLLELAAIWIVFTKANERGWASLIPIYNVFVWLRIADMSAWWFLLLLVPGADIVVWVLVDIGVAKNFGRGAGFMLGLIFFPAIFYPILAFSKDPRGAQLSSGEARTVLQA